MDNQPDQYKPGSCNIGKDEIAKRKKELWVSVFTTLLLSVAVFFFDSVLLWLVLFASVFFATLMYLQVSNRFCVMFGWIRKYNFGKRGKLEKVNDPAHIARDRKKVVIIGLQTFLFSLLYCALIYFLKRNFSL